MESPSSLDPRTLAKLKGLHLRARHIVEGYVSGLHRSPYHGFSIEFAEHREYAPGDDLRYVDWKVFGRTDKFYLKQYEDETNLLVGQLSVEATSESPLGFHTLNRMPTAGPDRRSESAERAVAGHLIGESDNRSAIASVGKRR